MSIKIMFHHVALTAANTAKGEGFLGMLTWDKLG